jgi:hypothetical protein
MSHRHRLFAFASILFVAACGKAPPLAPRASVAEPALAPATAPRLAARPPEPSTPPESIAEPEPERPGEPARPIDPFTIPDEAGRPIEVYPPTTDASRAPLVVMLHATCMKPASVCDWFGDAGRDTGWLVCPSGNGTCAGEPDWEGPGRTKGDFLERDLARVEERVGPFVEDRPGVLIGWSRGAFAARDMVIARRDLVARRFTGLVLIAAQVSPDAATLRAAGIRRVVMAAGDYDLSRPKMTAAIDALKRAGMDARYVSLGKIGHVWPADFEARMREPIAWAAERD